MNFDLLIDWMTLVKTGSWSAFKRSVEELLPEVDDHTTALRGARVAISDLGIADFFINGGSQWRIRRSAIGGTRFENRFIVTGARTSRLLEDIRCVAQERGVEFETSAADLRPLKVTLCGDASDVSSVAEAIRIHWSPSLPRDCISEFRPLSLLTNSAVSDSPHNWNARSFDVRTMKWVEGVIEKSSCEFSNRFGERQFFLHLGNRRFIAAGKRESVFAAAALRGIELAQFDSASGEVSVPVEAPLPEMLSRCATLCSGDLAKVKGGRFCYSGVSHSIAAMILAALNQRVPVSQIEIHTGA